MKNISTIIIDDQPIFVEGLISLLPKYSGSETLNFLTCHKSGEEALAKPFIGGADLVIMDISLPGMEYTKLLEAIKKIRPEVKIMVLTMHNNPKIAKAAIKSGADGFMLKIASKDELFHGIKEILMSKTFTGRGVVLAGSPSALGGSSKNYLEEKFSQKYGLTKREMEILLYIGQAMNNMEISKKLYISDQTVSVHRKNIMRKMNVKNTATLVKIAFEHSLV